MKKIIVLGGKGYARVVITLLKKLGNYEIIGYVNPIDCGKLLGYKYLGNDSVLEGYYHQNIKSVALGIGQLYDTSQKRLVVKKLKKIGFTFPTLISPTAIVNKNVVIGEGTVVRDGAIISTCSTVGNFSIIGTGVKVSYDTVIGDYVNISLGSNIGIHVNIGDDVLVGIGSTIMNHKKIIDECIIGAGSLIIKDCLEKGIYFGQPAFKKADKS